MADNTINVKLKQRIDNENNWSSKNPVLLKGEQGLVEGSSKYKIGDGMTSWNSLPYYQGMSSTDKSKLDGIAANANKYTHPSYTAKTSGLYKVTVDSTGHVSATTAATKSDVGLGNVNNTADTDKSVKYATSAGSADNVKGYVGTADISRHVWFSSSDDEIRRNYSDSFTYNPASQMLTTNINGNAATATNASKVNGHTVSADVPSGAKFTDTVYTHPTSSGNKHIPSGGSSGQILRWSANGTAVWGADNNTTYSNMTAATASAAGKAGLVPAPAAGKQTSFLRGDGTWVVPTNTTYSNFVKSGTGAKAGLVPAPSTTAGTTKYLREDGTWTVPPNTTYSDATASLHGLMSVTDKKALDVLKSPIATCATGRATAAKVATLSNFTLAVGTTIAVKFTDTAGTSNPTSGDLTLNVNSTGAKNIGYFRNGAKSTLTCSNGGLFYNNVTHIFTYDGTYWLCMDWNMDNNTTYSVATTSSNGLMSSTDKKKLDGMTLMTTTEFEALFK